MASQNDLQNNEVPTTKYVAICYASLLFLVCAYGLLLYTNTDFQLSYYLQALKFRGMLMIIGIAIGFGFYYLVVHPIAARLFNAKAPAWPIKIGIVGGCLCLSLLLGVFFNSRYSTLAYSNNFKIDSKRKGQKSTSAKYIQVTVAHENLDLRCDPTYWNNVSTNDSVYLCVRKGWFGYDYVSFADNKNAYKY